MKRRRALSGGALAQNQTGVTFRTARTDVDVALSELDDTPADAFGLGTDMCDGGRGLSDTAVQCETIVKSHSVLGEPLTYPLSQTLPVLS